MKRAVSLTVALLLWCGMASASQPQVQAALDRVGQLEAEQDFAGIIEVLAPLQQTKHPDVEFYLALAHMNQVGQGSTPADAIDFALSAAEHGSVQAWNLLYLIYANGFGAPVDGEKAIGFLRKGIEAGDHGAKLNYAVLLHQGSPLVQQNAAEACRLFDELADVEGTRAIVSYYRGVIAFRGECGRTVDKEAGMALVKAAADHGVREAERDMGRSHEFAWTGRANLRAALEWYGKAAEHGDPYSQWRLGMAHVRGEFQTKDPQKAVEFFRQATDAGYGDGMTSLAVMYATGEGVVQDFAKAKGLYEQAVEAGSAHALHNLAAMHLLGQGTPVDPVRARVSYLQALELGDDENPDLRKAIETALDADGLKRSDEAFEHWLAQRGRTE